MAKTYVSSIIERPTDTAEDTRIGDAVAARAGIAGGPGVALSMWRRGDFAKVVTAAVPLASVTATGALLLLADGALAVLAVWVLASLPIGVLIGHCVRNEE